MMSKDAVLEALKNKQTVCFGTSRWEVAKGSHISRYDICAVDLNTGNSCLVETQEDFNKCFIKIGGVGHDT